MGIWVQQLEWSIAIKRVIRMTWRNNWKDGTDGMMVTLGISGSGISGLVENFTSSSFSKNTQSFLIPNVLHTFITPLVSSDPMIWLHLFTSVADWNWPSRLLSLARCLQIHSIKLSAWHLEPGYFYRLLQTTVRRHIWLSLKKLSGLLQDL